MTAQNARPRQLAPLDQFSGSLSNRVYRSLKDAIYSLVYMPGEILRKGEVCDCLGVSRSPVSEAVAKLANEGLVKVVPQAGTYISRFSMDEVREGAFMREALELAAIEMVAQSISEDQLAVLRENLTRQQRMVDSQDMSGFFREDGVMHSLILSYTGFRNLAGMAEYSWIQVDRARHLHLPSPGRLQETMVEHNAIVDALAARDPVRARQVTQHHLGQLVKYLEPLEHARPELFVPVR